MLLETAKTPNLGDLARQSLCGLHQPVGTAVTPGSGPAHLALFGYDPLEYEVGRGVLSVLGIGFDLKPGDVAARGNFCTIDETGRVRDRRAGRISTDKNEVLCEKLRQVKVDNGVAELTGTVDMWSEREAQEENALEGGALIVDNDLAVVYGPDYYRP